MVTTEIKVWLTIECYEKGIPPCMTITCSPNFLSLAMNFVRRTFDTGYICLISENN